MSNQNETSPALGVATGSALSIPALKARAVIAGDLFREGRITRPECFRLEIDAATARDTGPIEYERNTEYADLVADGVLLNKKLSNAGPSGPAQRDTARPGVALQ